MYVSPHALLATLEDMAEIMGGDRRCCVSRELTKAGSLLNETGDAYLMF